jgi:hypothetical protein
MGNAPMKQKKGIPPLSSVAPSPRASLKIPVGLGLFVAFLAFSVYAWTGSPTLISCGDSAELTGAAASFGVAHAPGYPLFTMAGGIFSAILPGSPAHGVNLFNAFCGALAVGTLFVILASWTGQIIPAMAAALTLAFSYHFWLYCHVPEISALNAFFIGLLLCLSLPLLQEKRPPVSTKRMYSIALVTGLAFAHHHSIVFLMPGVLFCCLVWWKGKSTKPRPREWVGLGLCLVLGLTPYLYVPLRAQGMPYFNAGTVTTVARFFDHFTRRAYGVTALTPEYTPFNEIALESVLAFYGSSLVKSFSWPGVALGVLGFFVLLWRSPRVFFVLGVSGVLAGPFFLAWSGMPADTVVLRAILERFFVASFFLFAVGIGVGLARVQEKLKSSLFGQSFPRGGSAVALGVLLLLPLSLLAQNVRRLNFSDFDLCEVYGRDLFHSLPHNSVVFVHGDNSLFTLWSLQKLTRARTDVKILNSNISPAYADHLGVHFPELGVPPGITPTLKDLIATNHGRFPLSIIGIPGSDFKELGVLGNPYHLRPNGLAFDIVRQVGPEDESSIAPLMEFKGHLPEKWRGNYFMEELLYLYTIDHYNRAVIHSAQGHFRAALSAAQMALTVDPFFSLAKDLRDRMALRLSVSRSREPGFRRGDGGF